jgi:hypothetical protein
MTKSNSKNRHVRGWAKACSLGKYIKHVRKVPFVEPSFKLLTPTLPVFKPHVQGMVITIPEETVPMVIVMLDAMDINK